MINQKRKIVLGLGNLLNRDEGLGLHALNALRQRIGDPPGLELLDGGVMGLDLLSIVEDCSHLLLLDAIDAGQPGGTLVELSRDEIPLYKGVELSEHQVTFQEVLGLALFRDNLPEQLHLIGAQPADLEPGMEPSPQVAAILTEITDRSIRLLKAWGINL
jgi:hydrogenase maturation protease